jgi:predicted nucleic acid-binding protein
VKAVSNAGPLIALGKLGQLVLLLKLFDEVLVPQKVYSEVVVKGLEIGAADASSVDFLIQEGHIGIKTVTLPSPLPEWAQSIDMGEAEVIFLALEESADWVLIDNAHARRAARQMRLHPKGTIGLFLSAFEKGHLSLREFELLIHNIKAQPNLWISELLCDQALAKARSASAY